MRVAIAGYGQEGEASYRYWSALGHEVSIFDDKRVPDRPLPDDVPVTLGENAFEKLNGYNLVIRTASLSPKKIITDGKVWSATNEFFAKCPAPIIGVTGTKGKGTTASMIAEILKAAGHRVWLVGNIGKPALDVLSKINPSDFVVYELSSFQLWDAEKSPQIAVVLGIEADHLDNHSSMDDYTAAKANITKYQSPDGLLVFNLANSVANSIAESSSAKKVSYGESGNVTVKEGYFYYNEQKVCSISSVVIPGKHNLENACAAIAAVWPCVQSGEIIAKGLSAFKGLPHRLKLVREVNGVKYFDDSIATTPGATIAAIRAFDAPKILILGGSDKGADFNDLVDEIRASDSIRSVLCIGDTGPRISKLLQDSSDSNIQLLSSSDLTMSEVVQKAAASSEKGDVAILSPACASFGMFKSYSDRGDKFIKAVESL